MTPKCCNCKWMVGDYGWRPTDDHHSGTCHRRAPVAVKDDRMGTPNVALWPHIHGSDSCGDFDPLAITPQPVEFWLTLDEIGRHQGHDSLKTRLSEAGIQRGWRVVHMREVSEPPSTSGK